MENINFSLNKGDFLGIQGESGSGKTTLVDIILGIYKPSSGYIKVNNSNIHDDLQSWRSNVAYLPQDTFLIEGTIADNIAIGQSHEERSEENIISALSKAQIMNHINSLPKEYFLKLEMLDYFYLEVKNRDWQSQEHFIIINQSLFLMNQQVHLI